MLQLVQSKSFENILKIFWGFWGVSLPFDCVCDLVVCW